MADVVDHPLSDQELCQLGQAPGREGQVVVLRAGQGDLLDRLALGEGELRRSAAGVLRGQGVEPVGVEVVDHLTDPVLGGEGDLGDGRHVHGLGGPEHDLGSSPSDHRPRPPSDDREELVALGTGQLSDLHTFSHAPSLRDWVRQMVDAPPSTLPVTALVSPNLEDLANAAAIRRSGNLFRAFEAKWVPPAPAPFRDPGGWAVITATAVVVDGRIAREDIKVLAFPFSNHLSEETVTFTDFGTAPPVYPPPGSEVEQVTCGSVPTPGVIGSCRPLHRVKR